MNNKPQPIEAYHFEKVVHIEQLKEQYIIFFISLSYLEMFKIALEPLEKLGLKDNIILFYSDSSLDDEVSSLISNYVYVNTEVPSYGEWGTDTYKKVLKNKFLFLTWLPELGDAYTYAKEFYYSDVDVLHLKNPFEYFEAFEDGSPKNRNFRCDVVYSGDPDDMCAGQFYWKKNPAVQAHFEEVFEFVERGKKRLGDDQGAMHRALKRNNAGVSFDDRYCLADILQMPTGNKFAREYSDVNYINAIQSGDFIPYSLHFNCMVGKDIKLKKMREWYSILEEKI